MKRTQIAKTKKRMIGSIAPNFHEGSRSEILADYLFSGWGTVTPTRHQDDYGTDLYCTLTERIGQRAIVTDYFVVQVRSTTDPWEFESKEAVNWIVNYPIPIFFACVDKKKVILRLYHTNARFFAGISGEVGNRLELIPQVLRAGQHVDWTDGESFSLSAPVLEVTLSDFLDKKRMDRFRSVFARWVRIDRENCELRRRGLLRFRTPNQYRVNHMPSASLLERGHAKPDPVHLERLILNAVESAECLGGQIGRHADRMGALLAALFVSHLYEKHTDLIKKNLGWNLCIPHDLGMQIYLWLNEGKPAPKYYFERFDELFCAIKEEPLLKTFLAAGSHA